MKRVIGIYFTIIQELKREGIDVTTVTPAVMFEEMAILLEPFVLVYKAIVGMFGIFLFAESGI